MTRYGAQFGPDLTFPRVPAVDLDQARRRGLLPDPAGPLLEGR